MNNVVNDPNYDYRLAWLRGEQPQINQYDGRYHWASKTQKGEWLKSPQHPTAWKEIFMEQTGDDPDEFRLNPETAEIILNIRPF